MASQTHLKIVATETFFYTTPPLDLPAPSTYEITEYQATKPEEVVERIRDADVVTLSTTKISAEVLDPAVTPRLRAIFVVASGVDSVDIAACKARGIHVANAPHANATSVAEHAIALYFAARRAIPLTHGLTRHGGWVDRKTLMRTLYDSSDRPPRTLNREVLGIIGYGAVGKTLETLAKSMEMEVLISGRKDDAVADGRTPFETIIRNASVIVVCCPRTPETINLISEAEFNAMPSYTILVNISRGGVVDEKALVAALKVKKIAGAATDVFSVEPATPETCALLAPETADLNLVTTPHVAWVAEETNDKLMRTLKGNLHSWLLGNPTNRVV